ncbi:MAG TPA: hypothetical protein VN132_03305, partial [Bdellovibrio sp.]|nr:hypothetical protein [Bdellovibrio sp.]
MMRLLFALALSLVASNAYSNGCDSALTEGQSSSSTTHGSFLHKIVGSEELHSDWARVTKLQLDLAEAYFQSPKEGRDDFESKIRLMKQVDASQFLSSFTSVMRDAESALARLKGDDPKVLTKRAFLQSLISRATVKIQERKISYYDYATLIIDRIIAPKLDYDRFLEDLRKRYLDMTLVGFPFFPVIFYPPPGLLPIPLMSETSVSGASYVGIEQFGAPSAGFDFEAHDFNHHKNSVDKIEKNGSLQSRFLTFQDFANYLLSRKLFWDAFEVFVDSQVPASTGKILRLANFYIWQERGYERTPKSYSQALAT